MDIMTLAAKITLDAGQYEKGLRNAEKGMNNLGKTLSAKTVALGTFAGNMLTKVTTASFRAISSVVKKATDAYANYEQLVGGVQTLFGTREIKNARDYAKQIGLISVQVDKAGKTITKVNKQMAKTLFGDSKTVGKMSADEAANRAYAMAEQAQKDVMENAGKAYQTAGVSMNHYMETATAFAASMNQATGGDVIKSAALTDKAIRDMADNANKMGTDMASVENAYRGFAKGNYTMLDNLKLGYGGTKTEMQRLLKDASSITGEKYTIGNLADMVNAIHAIQEKNGITGTTEKEARGTIQGSKNMLSAAWENVLTALAAPEDLDLSGALASLTDSAKTYLNNLFPVVSKVMDGLGDFMSEVLPDVVEKIPEMIADFAPKLLKAGRKMVEGFGRGLKRAFQKVQWPTWDDVRNNVSKAWSTVKSGFDSLGKLIFGENADGTTKWPTWETIKETVSGVWDGVKTGFSELGKIVFGENADGTTGWPKSEEILGTAQGILDSAIESFRKLTNKFVFGEKVDGTTEGWPSADDIFNKANDIWTKALEKLSALTGFDFGSLFSVTLPNLAGDVNSWFEDQRRGLEQYLHDTFGYEHNHVADATQTVDQAKVEADAFIRNLEAHANNPQALRRDILQSGMEGKIPGLEAFVDFSTGRLKGSTTELKGYVNSWYEQNRTDAITSANEAAVAEQKTAEQRLAKAGENVESATAEYQKNMDKVSGTIQKTYDTLTNSETGFFKSNNGTDPLGLGNVDPKNMDQVADATSRMVNLLTNSFSNPMDFADALGLDYASAEDAATQVNSLIETINQYDEAKKKLEDATKEQEKAKAQVEETKTKQDQYTEALTKTGNAGTEAGNKTTEGMNKTNESASKATESVSGLKETIDSLKNKDVTITVRTVHIGGGAYYNPNSAGATRVGSFVVQDPGVNDDNSSIGYTAKGNWRVPYDDFVARLHRGEMVLTKSQARQFRDSGSGGIDIDGLVSSIVAAVREGMAGATVNSYLDGKSVTGRVNQRNANRDKARRFVTA